MPNGFTDEQINWLQVAVQKKAEFVANEVHLGERSKEMAGILDEIESFSDELAEAQKFTIEYPEKAKHFWSKAKGTKKNWSQGDRDKEVDTRHDLIDGYQADPAAVEKVTQMHAKLLAVQVKMETAKGADGELLFTARDIEREIWSPLVKANVIPSNAVADKYSQEAQVFHGACELYAERLTKHTKSASSHEKLQRRLGYAKDTISLIGTVAAQSIKIHNFHAVSMSAEEGRELKKLKDEKAARIVKFGPGSNTPDNLKENVNLKPEDEQKLQYLQAKSKQKKVATAAQEYTTMAIGFLNGVYDIVDKSLDKPDKERNWKIAEMAFTVVANAAVGSLKGINATESEESKKTNLSAAQNLIKYSLSGSKLVFRFHDILEAPPNRREQIAKAMIGTFADAVGNAFAAFDVPKGKGDDGTDKNTKGDWARIGGAITAAIVGASNGGEIIKQILEGKISNKAFATAMGINVVEDILAGTYYWTSDSARDQVGNKQTPTTVMQETDKERSSRLARQGRDFTSMANTMKGLNDRLLKVLPKSEGDIAKLEAAAVALNEATDEAERKLEMDAFNKKMKGEKYKKKFHEIVRKATAEHQAELMSLISEATQTPGDLEDSEKAGKAMAAMDKLIAKAEACKTKWAVLDQLTSGGIGILVKFLPAASLAAAIRKLAMDTALLVKSSIELNLWMKNTALTYGNDSVYGPAIKSRLINASIQVSHKTVNTLFSMLGVATESVKLADITGASTAMSITNSMARALSEFGYTMQKKAAVAKGWQIYKKARLPENKGDRKLAREAMKWNSTLSKCVLAYGIVEDGDPIAKEVGRNCGLTPEILENQHDVCQKVVQYFMSIYSDDPEVLRRIPLTQGWHPGTPVVTLESWIRFKVAAKNKAMPLLDAKSTVTPKIDSRLAQLDTLCDGAPGYAAKRGEANEEKQRDKAYGEFLEQALAAADGVIKELDAYAPRTAPVPEGVEKPWTEGMVHDDMAAIVDSLSAQTSKLRVEITYDQDLRDALLEEDIEKAFTALSKLDEWDDYQSAKQDFLGSGPEDAKDDAFKANWKMLKNRLNAFEKTDAFQALTSEGRTRKSANINREMKEVEVIYDQWTAEMKKWTAEMQNGDAPGLDYAMERNKVLNSCNKVLNTTEFSSAFEGYVIGLEGAQEDYDLFETLFGEGAVTDSERKKLDDSLKRAIEHARALYKDEGESLPEWISKPL